MKRNSIVFGFVGGCVGIAFKGTAHGATTIPVLASLQLRGISAQRLPAKWRPRAGLLLESIAATNPDKL
jgi:hypothetical protein